MRFMLTTAPLMLALGLAAPVLAGPVTDAATAVETAAAADDFNAWFQANEALLEAAWTVPGLHFGNIVNTTVPAPVYGNFEERADTVYAPGEPILIYAEPRGYGYGDIGGGMLEIAFGVDLRVLDPAGTVLLEMPEFSTFTLQSRAKARELMFNLSVSLDGAPPGDYQLEFTFNDRYGGQSDSFVSNITIK
ncbi:MAG: hypothetical protein B7Z10_04940 [Rhodobacterales bacterium 32-66-7]|nr:MAG: hypothetical protein B7Z31_02885 [Rhodobacterales bacterium 12-65-15]OYX25848.1 MAG: hypothetical protein B7Z10_04940 [Rhodobacterales bacterium 32-66-7]